MGFWDGAISTFDTGIRLGVRAKEREEDLALRTKERTEDREERKGVRRQGLEEREGVRAEERRRYEDAKERTEVADVRQGILFSQGQNDRSEKKQLERVTKKFQAAQTLFDAGDERLAAKLLTDTYNDDLTNGDEIRVIFKSDAATPEMQQKWETDPNFKGKDVAVLSKQQGILPFKTMREVMKYTAAHLNQKTYLEGMKHAEDSIAVLNAKEEPFLAKDGHHYIQTWEVGKGGMPQKGPITPYKRPVKASEQQKKITGAEEALGTKLTGEQKRIGLGLRQPEQQPEQPSKALARDQEAIIRGSKVSEIENVKAQKEAEDILRLFKGRKGGEYSEKIDDVEPAMSPVEEAMAVADGKIEAPPVLVAKAKRLKELLSRTSGKSIDPTALDSEMKRRGFVKGPDGLWKKPGGTTRSY